ncbi:MAG: hypothetical protein SNJ70_11000, partial [Armatimonadota bacterium]
MNAAVAKAKELGGYIWLYDEDLWPSGNAGGQVAGMKDEYRATTLDAVLVAPGEDVPEIGEDQAIKYCYIIKERDGLLLRDAESIPVERASEATELERLFLIRRYTEKIGWWGGESYANLMHPEAMQQFIKMTHEVYKEKLGDEFGKTIPGIFTDEPQVSFGFNKIPWYDGLPEKYKEWHGRDFIEDLPYIYFEGKNSRKIRLLIHRTINKQFLEAYSKPIFEWCEQNNLEHTGHYNAEDSLHSQIICHYGGVMSHYRYQHAPGIDHLCRHTDALLLCCKQVSSAARQLGRPRILTEIFGVSRHTNTFEEFKWIGNYDLAMGATFFCPHLTWYSALGRRKRDYPPNWNYQQTYWNDLKPLNDYFTRVSYFLMQGKPAAKVLILHPIESATAGHRFGVEPKGHVIDQQVTIPVNIPTEDFGAAHYFDQMLRRTLNTCLNAGYDCDLGDETFIDDMASVNGREFKLGEMSYEVVVVPPSTTWRPKTFEMIKKFADAGGSLIFVGELPYEVDCDNARNEWIKLANMPNVDSVPCAEEAIACAISNAFQPRIKLTDRDGKIAAQTYIHHRIDNENDMLFIINNDKNSSRSYTLKIKDSAEKGLVKWDALEGKCYKIAAESDGKDLIYRFCLPACGSILLTTGDVTEAVEEAKSINCCSSEIGRLYLDSEYEFERTDDNVLVLDRMSVSYDGGNTFSDEDLDCRIRKSVSAHFGTTASLQWQPWVSIRKKLFDKKGGPIVLRYKFDSDLDQPQASIVIEQIEKGNLIVNGAAVDTSYAGWHWDRGFGKVDISKLIKEGENVVDFAVNYDFLTEIEAAYIVGNFGVKLSTPFRGKIISEW